VVATYADGPLAGAVAVARHRAGAGRTLYIGATLDEETLTTLLAACVAEAGVPTPSLPDGVELTTRGGAAVVVNHSGASVHLDLDSLAPECTTGACGGPVVDLLGGPAPVGGSLELAPYGAAALVHVHRDPPTIAGAR
jgi:beta-galactosidase